MNRLTFDETTHTYYLDGQKIPSVTQILKPLYDFSAVPADMLQRAADFGTAVHKTVELYLRDDLDENTLDEALVKPLEAFKVWLMDHPEMDRLWTIETPTFHEKLKYAGTPDLVCSDVVIDVKSRPVNLLTDPIQTAAYDRMDGGSRQHFILELKQDGTYCYTQMNKARKAADLSWSRFRYLLDYHHMSTQINLWRKAA